MRALKFKLSGKTACFRKAEFNAYAYFTYNNIHKPALLGLLGAIVGYGGYNQQKKEERYPEYYEKFKDLRVAILPITENVVFSRKTQVFNNSVGYASKEEGGNLVVREQWLENPCWYIYILEDNNDEYKKLKEFLSQSKAVYMPYLGKNDHKADISDFSEVELNKSDSLYINSIVVGENISYSDEDFDGDNAFLVKENVPVALESTYNFAVYSESVYTNFEYDNINIEKVYSDGDINLFFF